MPLPKVSTYTLTFDDKHAPVTVHAARSIQGSTPGEWTFLDAKGDLVATHRYVRSCTVNDALHTREELLSYIAELEAELKALNMRATSYIAELEAELKARDLRATCSEPSDHVTKLRTIYNLADGAPLGTRAATLRAIRSIADV